MNDRVNPLGPDELLADWCALDLEVFRCVYEPVIRGSEASPWSVLVARCMPPATGGPAAGSRQALIQAACRDALIAGRLDELVIRVAKVQEGFNLSSAAEVEDIVRRIIQLTGGRMQALVKPGGLLGRNTLFGVLDVDNATAIVRMKHEVIGTAFLVRPDLVLTAGHVVLRPDTDCFLSELKAQLSFSFLTPGARTGASPVVAYPAAGGLVLHSLPWGRPPDRLYRSPAAGSDACLDYALVRLDREIHHVKWLDISQPPRPAPTEPLLILGYPGGTAMAWQVGEVAAVGTERVEHSANAKAGMSGSCCIDVNGYPVALHEGSVDTERYAYGGQQESGAANRGVCLAVIRASMLASAGDPLVTPRSTPRHALMDEVLVRRWGHAGLRLAPASLQAAWRQLVGNATGWAPEQPGSPPAFHPWFKREEFETWIDQNLAKPESRSRLCVVSGPPGTGKSFLSAILLARAGGPTGADVALISATQTTAWSWREAMAHWGVPVSDADLRPAAGAVRHDEVPAAARRIAEHAGRQELKTPPPLFVLIDFDGEASFSIDEEERPWLPFMQQLLGYPWIRLVVVGAPDAVASRLTDRVEDENEGSRDIELRHVDHRDFRSWVRLMLRRGDGSEPVQDNDVATAMKLHEDVVQALPEPALRSVATVLAAMLVRQGLEG